MTQEFTFKVSSMEALNDGSGTIRKVFFTYTLNDGDDTVSEYGDILLPPPSEDHDFVAQEELTPDLIESWSRSVLGPLSIKLMEERLQLQLQKRRAPEVIPVKLPWVKEPEPETEIDSEDAEKQ